jgi:hypothetical protein
MRQILGADIEDVYEYFEMAATRKMPHFWLSNENLNLFHSGAGFFCEIR